MKKIFLKILLILICSLLVSCNTTTNQQSNDHGVHDNGLNTEDENVEEITENPQKNESNDDSGNQEVPTVLVFYSVEDIKTFLSAAEGTSKQYNEFVSTNSIYSMVNHDVARQVALEIESFSLPFFKQIVSVDSIGWTYYIERKELDIICIVDGVRYRFIYEYGETNAYKYSGNPVIKELSFGNVPIDIYKTDGGFIGSVVDDSGVIKVIIYTDDASNVSFDVFEFKKMQADKTQ